MPSTSSMVFSSQNSGAICTMPPMVTTRKAKIERSVTFFSRIVCLSRIPIDRSLLLFGRDNGVFGFNSRTPSYGHVKIVAHDDATSDVEHPAQTTHDVHGQLGIHGVGERVHEEAVCIHFAPHQALHDAGHPHGGGVEDDADGREPEVPADHAQAVKAFTVPQLRHKEV